ncbi:uncharacterized protein LTR77_001404 [Saxophila tyrrhenica]|uniref:F-box domain-containing protein n=1 Tax=Saxophila tyrrhenica TaxID=1690608 RepID=A0AAV9PNM0_9PEZI|nr:hypothetical protein LTR77_001404 [Saxophila tyrrhenica]
MATKNNTADYTYLPVPLLPGQANCRLSECVPRTVHVSAAQETVALDQQLKLKEIIETISTQVDSVEYESSNSESNITVARSCLNGLSTFLGDILATQTYNERRLHDSKSALRTFEIPEVLELILDTLPLHDLLRVWAVNGAMRDAIQHSSQLQRKLCLRPASPGSNFYAPFDLDNRVAPGFICAPHSISDSANLAQRGRVRIEASFALYPGQKLGGITPRARRMLVCQPPIQNMFAKVRCCGRLAWPQEWSFPGFTRVMEQRLSKCQIGPSDPGPGGLTIGDLYDCAVKVTEHHRYCGKANARQLDSDGFVNARVTFQGDVQLTEEDPLWGELERKQNQKQSEKEEERRTKERFGAYTEAKRTGALMANEAHENERPVPTLEQFLELDADPHWDWATGQRNHVQQSEPHVTT